MSRPVSDYESMSYDDFEEALADKPRNERWELIGGRVVRMMVGARWEHARIVQNVARQLENRFEAAGSDCQTFAETFYMKQKALSAQLLPDVMVVCGDLEPGATSTAEPVVVIEVLSVGTEGRDRIMKWQIYQQLPSIQHYVLVSRERPHVEMFSRHAGTWNGMTVLDGLDAVLELNAIGVSLPLAAIYRRVLSA
jgi:Uma2 family endonuclease